MDLAQSPDAAGAPPRWHDLKTDPEVFDDTAAGRKTCEIRLDDRHFQVGDGLRLHRTEHTGAAMKGGAPLVYSGQVLEVLVTHVLRGPIYGLQPGWVMLSHTPPRPAAGAQEAAGWAPAQAARAWLERSSELVRKASEARAQGEPAHAQALKELQEHLERMPLRPVPPEGGAGKGWLHLFAQNSWHQPAYVAGSATALQQLAWAVSRALADGQSAFDASTGDGEGYTTFVLRLQDEEVQRLQLPYTDAVAAPCGAAGLHPRQLLQSGPQTTGGGEPGRAGIRQLPAVAPRLESGPVQFGDDWPGTFIRGDNAFGYLMAVDRLLEAKSDDPIAKLLVSGLRDLLAGCDLTGLSRRSAEPAANADCQ